MHERAYISTRLLICFLYCFSHIRVTYLLVFLVVFNRLYSITLDLMLNATLQQ